MKWLVYFFLIERNDCKSIFLYFNEENVILANREQNSNLPACCVLSSPAGIMVAVEKYVGFLQENICLVHSYFEKGFIYLWSRNVSGFLPLNCTMQCAHFNECESFEPSIDSWVRVWKKMYIHKYLLANCFLFLL